MKVYHWLLKFLFAPRCDSPKCKEYATAIIDEDTHVCSKHALEY